MFSVQSKFWRSDMSFVQSSSSHPLSFSAQHKPQNTTRYLLQNGTLVIATSSLTFVQKPILPEGICLEDDSVTGDVVHSYPTAGWKLFATDTTQRRVFFEAQESCLLAVLNLEDGSWEVDDNPLFFRFSLDQTHNEEDQRTQFSGLCVKDNWSGAVYELIPLNHI